MCSSMRRRIDRCLTSDYSRRQAGPEGVSACRSRTQTHVLDQLGPVEPLGELAVSPERVGAVRGDLLLAPLRALPAAQPFCAFSSARSESGSLALSPIGGARRRTRCRADSSGGWRPSPGRPPSHAGAPGRARRSSSCRWRLPACRLPTSSTRNSSTRPPSLRFLEVRGARARSGASAWRPSGACAVAGQSAPSRCR
jgi:hypothetical protein